jgi:hypothetical protein
VILTLAQVESIGEIPPEGDPRQVDGAATRRRRLTQLSPAQRAILVLERYPELRVLPNIDWQRLSARASFRILFGESSRHFAHLELAALAGVVASAGISPTYASEVDASVRRILDLVQQRFGIATPQAITRDVWDAWGCDTDLMRTLTIQLTKYAAGVNYHLADYRERLTSEDRARLAHLLLPAIPRQFWKRFVPAAEQRAATRRRRKAKTDVVSECALAILALMLARYPSTERFIRWYRRQIERIETGELRVPAQLTYEDDELDLPRQPGPDAVNVADLRWRTTPVHLNLTIWRPIEFSERRYANWTQRTAEGTPEHHRACIAQHEWQRRARTGVYADPHAYFVEAHPSDAMPWFMAPATRWHARLGQRRGGNAEADGRLGTAHAGLGTPEDWLVSYLGNLVAADRRARFHARPDGVCFDPEATFRGVLFGTAVVTLMLTADARIHEILQISADRFVKPVRVYIVKNPDGTPKRDPGTNRIVTDIMVEQRLLPKGRKRDDLRLPYDVSAARLHLQEITRLLKAAGGGEIPVVRYDPRHPKAEQLGAERFLFQWNGRHARKSVMNSLIRFVLDGIVLVDRSGAPMDVTSHLLRHAAATVQRQRYGVPVEILAETMGHTLTADGHAPDATRYYSQMTETQKAEIRHEAILAMTDDAKLAVRVIDPDDEAKRINRLIEEGDERTREILDRYGGLHPVTFGHCGFPGLCVRGTARSYCIGCAFLVRRPEYLDRVDFFLDSYGHAADVHERMGDLAGARERHRLIAQLKQLRSEMLLLAEAERQSSWTPRWKQLQAGTDG